MSLRAGAGGRLRDAFGTVEIVAREHLERKDSARIVPPLFLLTSLDAWLADPWTADELDGLHAALAGSQRGDGRGPPGRVALARDLAAAFVRGELVGLRVTPPAIAFAARQAPTTPPPKAEPAKQPAKTWIAIEVVDGDGTPCAGTRFELTLPDNSIRSGSTDRAGLARVDGIDPGSCKVSFPDLHDKSWRQG